ncbi:unnamed protein product [Schistosoma curassoni]|uniref:CACTA en-spm transposon protein n=1 Tax=Schistosoma curassoni TaxID=6186 RepID=A0A183KQW8_9TREM|nr:unnamed protein product [Schistosoma curassoni]
MQLDDLDYANGLARQSHMQQQMQDKTTNVAATSEAVVPLINFDNDIRRREKAGFLRYNTTCTNQTTFDGEALEDVKTSTYLGSIIDEHGGSDTNSFTVWGGDLENYMCL